MIKLPSNYVPYNFTSEDLELNLMTGKELSLMSKAIIADDITYAVEAIGNVINVDVNELAIADFYALLLMARFKSMPHSPMEGNWICQGSVYRDIKTNVEYNHLQLQVMLKAFEKDPENNPDPDKIKVETVDCSHKNEKHVDLDDFEVLYLDENITLPEGFDFPRVKILSSLLESFTDPEQCLLATAAQWIKEGDTVSDKIDIMNKSPLTFYDELSKFNAANTFGMIQNVVKACDRCGTRQILSIQITPDMFFRL